MFPFFELFPCSLTMALSLTHDLCMAAILEPAYFKYLFLLLGTCFILSIILKIHSLRDDKSSRVNVVSWSEFIFKFPSSSEASWVTLDRSLSVQLILKIIMGIQEGCVNCLELQCLVGKAVVGVKLEYTLLYALFGF